MFDARHPLPITLVLILLLAVTIQLTFAGHAEANLADNGGTDPPMPPGGDGTTQTLQTGLIDALIAKIPWILRLAMI